ncbi:MAG: hypothetical protein AMS27_11515 [Bacteroides sp. SM23_62_1]|nr:MAG: hypothetical protein AMS27_11515 [Bacteroides sp. SM23_62_1]
MKRYFYLTATPESLVASHLPPVEFGNYLAVGTKKNIRGQAIFFEVDAEKMKDFPWKHVEKRLIPYEDGEPKRSVYLSIYRVFENIPVAALNNLYLVTDDGKVLELQPSEYKSPGEETHLYQQFNPITTRVASKLSPPEFVKFLTDSSKPVYTPKIFFAEMQLGQMAKDPNAPLHNLPYPNPDHLRDCLVKLQQSPERQTKTVLRCFTGQLSYRCIKDGFYFGDQKDFLFYPFPSVEELEDKYYSWWRSALVQCF